MLPQIVPQIFPRALNSLFETGDSLLPIVPITANLDDLIGPQFQYEADRDL